MRFTLIALAACAVACALRPCSAQRTSPPTPPTTPPPLAQQQQQSAQADLIVSEYQFAPTDERALRVNVANLGGAGAGASVLRLKVRQIKGNPTGRVLEAEVPAIPANGNVWVSLQTDAVVPKDVSLKDTVFVINLDVRNAVNEANENNNETWHNKNKPANKNLNDG